MLSTSSRHGNTKTVFSLIGAAMQEGIETYLYLIDDGVNHIGQIELNALENAGVRIFACAYSAQQRGIPTHSDSKITFSGLVTLSDMIKGCDRFITFN